MLASTSLLLRTRPPPHEPSRNPDTWTSGSSLGVVVARLVHVGLLSLIGLLVFLIILLSRLSSLQDALELLGVDVDRLVLNDLGGEGHSGVHLEHRSGRHGLIVIGDKRERPSGGPCSSAGPF